MHLYAGRLYQIHYMRSAKLRFTRVRVQQVRDTQSGSIARKRRIAYKALLETRTHVSVSNLRNLRKFAVRDNNTKASVKKLDFLKPQPNTYSYT